MIKHPLLYNYLNNSEGPRKLKYLPAFNAFTNYMNEEYSYKISREYANNNTLENESIFNDIKDNKFKQFGEAWKNIYKDATKYRCRNTLKPKILEKGDKLIFFLIDDNEISYLAAACQNFITWQNNFLQPIIETAIFYGNLNYYVDNMRNKIPVQQANPNQILSIDDCFNKSLYEDFDDIIYTFSKRDIFDKEGKINYLKYNSYQFDFSLLEEELGKLILPEKCLFEGDEEINFITFWGEGFRGGKSEILSKFYLKYPQKDLTEEEKNKIFSYIQKISGDNIKIKNFFSSIQLIIFYLTNNNFSVEEKINNILEKAPEYLKINRDYSNFSTFFKNEGNSLKANQLMNIFFYIEHLVFEDLLKTLHQEYKAPIDKNLEEEIKEKLLNNTKNEDKLFIKDLSAALRRFISRYLAGSRQTTDINENNDLEFQLSRIDLWEEKYSKINNLDELISEKINCFNLKVGQALEFYKIIGNEDKNSIEEIKTMNIKNNENNENEQNSDNEIDNNYDENSEENSDDGRKNKRRNKHGEVSDDEDKDDNNDDVSDEQT